MSDLADWMSQKGVHSPGPCGALSSLAGHLFPSHPNSFGCFKGRPFIGAKRLAGRK